MSEQINLTSPDQASVGTSDYKVVSLSMVFEGPEGSFIYIGLQSANGLRRNFVYSGSIATQLLIALNKIDLTVKSLQRRILERLISDGKLAGTISGAPD